MVFRGYPGIHDNFLSDTELSDLAIIYPWKMIPGQQDYKQDCVMTESARLKGGACIHLFSLIDQKNIWSTCKQTQNKKRRNISLYHLAPFLDLLKATKPIWQLLSESDFNQITFRTSNKKLPSPFSLQQSYKIKGWKRSRVLLLKIPRTVAMVSSGSLQNLRYLSRSILPESAFIQSPGNWHAH